MKVIRNPPSRQIFFAQHFCSLHKPLSNFTADGARPHKSEVKRMNEWTSVLFVACLLFNFFWHLEIINNMPSVAQKSFCNCDNIKFHYTVQKQTWRCPGYQAPKGRKLPRKKFPDAEFAHSLNTRAAIDFICLPGWYFLVKKLIQRFLRNWRET